MAGKFGLASAIIILICFSVQVKAKVIEVEQDYFHIQIEHLINAPVSTTNLALLDIASWWSKDHTYSGDNTNLYLDTGLQRCFCEKLAGGGLVVHMQVVNYQVEKRLRFTGGLGPLQSLPVSGVLDFQLTQHSDTQTRLTVSYRVNGSHSGLKEWSKAVDQVLAEQLLSLKRQAELND